MTAGDRLAELAAHFAEDIADLLNRTITRDLRIGVRLDEGASLLASLYLVEPYASAKESVAMLFPMSVAEEREDRERAPLWLKLQFSCELDPEGEHLAVRSSVFGLCIKPGTGFCPLRVEYDRHKDHKQAAHIQIHGESAGLGWAYAQVGRPPMNLEKLHIPVGGRRFRPTIEDFIEFLDQESLLPQAHPGWLEVVAASRTNWEERQVRATVRRAPEIAAAQLRLEGYEVTRLEM